MISFRAILTFALSAGLVTVPAFAAAKHHSSHSKTTSSHSATVHKTSAHTRGKSQVSRSHRLHGQQAIDSQRVTQIQQALVREHYLNHEPNGEWDSATQAAMQKYQADQGWQTRLMPDSRALVKLGLGPDYSSAINAKDSSFAAPPASPSPAPSTSLPSDQTAAFTAASGVNR
jgi:hypothetical protein